MQSLKKKNDLDFFSCKVFSQISLPYCCVIQCCHMQCDIVNINIFISLICRMSNTFSEPSHSLVCQEKKIPFSKLLKKTYLLTPWAGVWIKWVQVSNISKQLSNGDQLKPAIVFPSGVFETRWRHLFLGTTFTKNLSILQLTSGKLLNTNSVNCWE